MGKGPYSSTSTTLVDEEALIERRLKMVIKTEIC